MLQNKINLGLFIPNLTTILQKIKKLLIFIANAVPFTPNWNHIRTAIEIGDLRTLKHIFRIWKMLAHKSMSKATSKFNQLESPSKIYLENPNQLYAISTETPDKGTVA